MSTERTVVRSSVALLLALLTLLCALCPVGLPASQKLGPAFNPANEVVTVRPEATTLSPRIAAEKPDPRGPAPALFTSPVVHFPRIARVRPYAPVPTVPPPAEPAASPFAPRAPPLLA